MAVFSSEIKLSEFPVDTSISMHHTPVDTIMQFNQFGSFGLHINGIKANVETEKYNLLANYSYQNFDGYRAHSNEYSHTLNLMLETRPSVNTKLWVIGYYFNGREMRPGSLTKSEFEQNPFQSDPRAVNRDEKRISSKGQLDINYRALFGKSLHQKIEISGIGRIEYFERSTKEFKIISRYGLGLTVTYTNTERFWNRLNEFSAGGNVFTQPETMEEYENFSGQRSDQLEQLKREKTNSSGCFISDYFELVTEKLYVQVSGKYDNVIYKLMEETLPSRSDKKTYHAITPKIGVSYKITRGTTLFTSYGFGFKSPIDKELDSPDPTYLYNQALTAQTSNTFEAGIKVDLAKKEYSVMFRKLHLRAKFFKSKIDHEIVPYEIFGDEFYRNATKTNRYGFEVGSQVELFKDLTFLMDWTYSHFIYKSYTANSLETDLSGNIVNIFRNFAGNSETNVPRNNLNLSLLYDRQVGEKTGIFAKVSYLYNSGLWVDDANTNQTRLFNLVNAIIGFDLKLGHFMFSASSGVNNIFDQVYVGFANTNSADKRFYDAGAPRNYTGSLNVGFVF